VTFWWLHGRLLRFDGTRIYLSLKTSKYFVLDEADVWLDMGFINDIKRSLETARKKAFAIFSATMPSNIVELFSKNPS